MEKLLLDSNFRDMIQSVNLQRLISTYMLLKPGTSQTDIAKKLKTGQMTVSRILSNGHPVKREWLPAVAEMLRELDSLNINQYVDEMRQIAGTCAAVTCTELNTKVSKIVFEQLLWPESKDYEQRELSYHGFSCFSWDEKITWVFRNVDNLESLRSQGALGQPDVASNIIRYFPKRTDRVTLFTTNARAYEYAVSWCGRVKPKSPAFDYLDQQEHTIILVDTASGTIVKNERLIVGKS